MQTSRVPMAASNSIQPARKVFDKDILTVGTWWVGGRRWEVTRRTLVRLVENFRRAAKAGVRIPVVWNHSHDARDQIGEILALYQVGDTLRARFWAADPTDIRRLGVTVHQVSVEVHQPWRDGRGNLYDIMLVHLGVVHLPVVANQGPFHTVRFLSLGGTVMNEASENVQGAGGEPPDLISIVHRLLDRLGPEYQLPTDTTAENLSERLEQLLAQLAPGSEEPEEVALLQLRLDYERAVRELEEQRQGLQQQRREIFVASLDRLIGEGRISSADRPAILEAADPTGYTLGLLAPFERIPVGTAVPTQRLAKRRADASPPAVSGAASMTADRAGEIARSFTHGG